MNPQLFGLAALLLLSGICVYATTVRRLAQFMRIPAQIVISLVRKYVYVPVGYCAQECTAAGDGGASATTKVYEFWFFYHQNVRILGFLPSKCTNFVFFFRKCTNIGASSDVPDVPRRTSVPVGRHHH